MSPDARQCRVVDTNVLVTANHRNGSSYTCASNCAQALLWIKASGCLAIDDRDRVLSEYRRYCSHSGQPGVGDYFFRWIYDSLGQEDLVCRVTLSPRGDSGDFAEFPAHPDLAKFDLKDKKFVAVANAHQDKPPILQASDTKWWGWKEALQACGLTVEFLCPDEIQAAFERKFEVD
jgi:hypothetical protein